MKIKLKASYTIENSIIVPMFIFVIISLLYLNFYMHDKIITKSVVTRVGIGCESGNGNNISEQNIEELKKYLLNRCIFLKQCHIKVVDNKLSYNVIGGGKEKLLFNWQSKDTSLQVQSQIGKNYAPNVIRVLNALNKVAN